MDKPTFIAAWFGAALSTLIFSFLFTFYLSNPKVVNQTNQSFKLYAALPDNGSGFYEVIDSSDARPQIIDHFFKGHNAPLESFGKVFVETSDKYRLDFRLLPSIAMQESNGGKKVISDSYNPFGYGIYGGQVKKFASYEEAIERVGKGLREDYLDKGLDTPEKIMTKYTPSSVDLGGPWAEGVAFFMEELR